MPPEGQILAADIGGTHARFLFGSASHAGTPAGEALDLVTRDAGGMEGLLAGALERLGLQPPAAVEAVFAMAGPVRDGQASLTNLSWKADAATLKRRFGFRHLSFINDLEAAARALAEHPPADAAVLRAGGGGAGRSVVISVGTGLGAAYWSGAGHELQVESSEAGHVGFAPTEAWQWDLLQALQQRHGEHVSWERVVSGAGLAFLDAHLRRGEPGTPAEVAHRAAAGDTPALEALERFSRLLGVFAGDLVLAAPASGVWLTGGVLAGLGPLFDSSAFLEGFDAKGRLSPVPAGTPVRRTDDGTLGVRGAWLTARHQANRRALWANP